MEFVFVGVTRNSWAMCVTDFDIAQWASCSGTTSQMSSTAVSGEDALIGLSSPNTLMDLKRTAEGIFRSVWTLSLRSQPWDIAGAW
jgi:hypothetical protein